MEKTGKRQGKDREWIVFRGRGTTDFKKLLLVSSRRNRSSECEIRNLNKLRGRV